MGYPDNKKISSFFQVTELEFEDVYMMVAVEGHNYDISPVRLSQHCDQQIYKFLVIATSIYFAPQVYILLNEPIVKFS